MKSKPIVLIALLSVNLFSYSQLMPKDCLFGALKTQEKNFQTNKEVGLNMAVFELSWRQMFPEEGKLNKAYIEERLDRLQKLRAMGFKIQIGFGTQYPPDWIYHYEDSRFVNQYGDPYTHAQGNGDIAVNAVYSRAMRDKIEEYINEVFRIFGTDFYQLRLGWMRYGEIGYPYHHGRDNFNGRTNCYWAFDPFAQGLKPGLPDGIPVCPVPGWKPGDASPNGEARKFMEWYLDALVNYQNWQVDLVAKHSPKAKLAILYPGWGIRSAQGRLDAAINDNLGPGSIRSGETPKGNDFKRMVEAINNPNVVVYCTFLDPPEQWSNNNHQSAPAASNNFYPAKYLTYYARQHPFNLKVMGENTGRRGMEGMTTTFKNMKECDIEGLMWAFEPLLYGDPMNGQTYDGEPTIWDYRNHILEYIGTDVDEDN